MPVPVYGVPSFGLTPESADVQSLLAKQSGSHNAKESEIENEQAELNAVPAGEWTSDHTKRADKLGMRKRELAREKLAILESGDAYYSRLRTVDSLAARHAAYETKEIATQEAVTCLINGGWPAESIDHYIVSRNAKVRDALVALDAIDVASIQQLQEKNLEAVAAANEQFAKVKSAAMRLAV